MDQVASENTVLALRRSEPIDVCGLRERGDARAPRAGRASQTVGVEAYACAEPTCATAPTQRKRYALRRLARKYERGRSLRRFLDGDLDDVVRPDPETLGRFGGYKRSVVPSQTSEWARHL